MGKRGSRVSCFSGDTLPVLRNRGTMSTKLLKIAQRAKWEPKARFTSLAHVLTPAFLLETWTQLNRRGAGGVDGQSMTEIEEDLERQIADLWQRL